MASHAADTSVAPAVATSRPGSRPPGRGCATETLSSVSLRPVEVGVGEVDEVDGAARRGGERRVVVVDGPLGRRPGTTAIAPTRRRRAAQQRPQARVGARLARDRQVLVADEVDDDDGRRARGRGRRRRRGCRAAPRGRKLGVGRAARALLAVEHHEADLALARAPPRAQGPRQLEHRRRAGRTVVGADEARDVLRVVVRPHQDRPARGPAGRRRRCAGRRARASKRPSRQPRPQALGQATRGLRAGRPRPERDLRAEVGERAARRRSGRAAAPAVARGAGAAAAPDEGRATSRAAPRARGPGGGA